jgi:flagellum-specific peptidoglycan hydrolase FlgJ
LNQDAEGFISGLQKGGFATDPGYGGKLRRIIGGNALRQAISG